MIRNDFIVKTLDNFITNKSLLLPNNVGYVLFDARLRAGSMSSGRMFAEYDKSSEIFSIKPHFNVKIQHELNGSYRGYHYLP